MFNILLSPPRGRTSTNIDAISTTAVNPGTRLRCSSSVACLLVPCARRPGPPPAAQLHLSTAAPTRIQQGIDRLATAHAAERPEIRYLRRPLPLAGRLEIRPSRSVSDPVVAGEEPAAYRSGEMRQQRGGAGRRGDDPGFLTRAVDRVFRFVRLAEFEIFFVLFFLIAFFLFKQLVSTHTLEPRVSLPMTVSASLGVG